MATKSAGMPSEVASSASPRYLRTFGMLPISGSSRQSRIASAISVGVISSSPAPSAAAFTTAMALRIRSAADTTDLLGGLARSDHDAPFGFLADARAGDVRVAFEGQMNGAAFESLHGVERDGVAGHLHLARRAERDLAHGVLAALAVTLHVHDHTLALVEMLAHHHIGDRLQRAQGFAAPADQRAQVAAADVERDGVAAGTHLHGGAHAHVLEQALEQRAHGFGLSIGGRSRSPGGRLGVDDHHLDHGLLGTLAKHLDV